MLVYQVISFVTLFGMFALFLVLSKTLNGIINQLAKVEYIVKREYDFRKEAAEINFLLDNPNGLEA